MKTIFRFITICITIIILIPVSLFTIYAIEVGFGYFPGGHFLAIAKLAAERENVELCNKIIDTPWPQIFGPTTDDAQISCIHEYAKLTKDPSACELLMPSSYGWDCLGAAEKPNARMCWFDFGKNATQVGNAVMPECGSGDKALSAGCCDMGKALFVSRISSCETYKDTPAFYDQCLEQMAKRDKKLDPCYQIQNENIRSGCEVAARALQKK